MRCARVTKFTGYTFENIDNVIELATTEKPILDQKKKQLLVKVLACSISAGDSIMLSGSVIFLRSKLPFIPGMDICGVVEDISEKVDNFKVGDTVVANNGMLPIGGMAEYMVVDASRTVLKPPSVSTLEGSCCMSAITSYNAVNSYVKQGSRLLILGGSGGVGSSAIQVAKAAGASYICTTSTQQKMCLSLGADEVIDYRKENWWEMPKFTNNKFDVIIDTVGDGNFYGKAPCALKKGFDGGKFVAVTGDDPHPDLSTWFKLIVFFAKTLLRPLWTWINRHKYPSYISLMPKDEMEALKEVLKMIDRGKLKIALDKESPHDFSESGVIKAFQTQCSGHAHGKVAVNISQDTQKLS